MINTAESSLPLSSKHRTVLLLLKLAQQKKLRQHLSSIRQRYRWVPCWMSCREA